MCVFDSGLFGALWRLAKRFDHGLDAFHSVGVDRLTV